MALVKNLEGRMKQNRQVALGAIALSVIIVISGFVFSYRLIQDSRKSIYVLDNGVPILVKQTDLLLNRPVEYRAQIALFHNLFFTLTGDDKFIKAQVEKSLYLVDESGMKEYQNLKEKGFYNQVISSNSIITVEADSIKIDEATQRFIYYGTQTINRKTQLVIRKLITEGYIKDVPRSPNNAHGVLLTNWKTIDNSDLSVKTKYR